MDTRYFAHQYNSSNIFLIGDYDIDLLKINTNAKYLEYLACMTAMITSPVVDDLLE